MVVAVRGGGARACVRACVRWWVEVAVGVRAAGRGVVRRGGGGRMGARERGPRWGENAILNDGGKTPIRK